MYDCKVIIFFKASHLCKFLLLERDLSIVADLPQGGPEAPLVSRDAQSGHVLHALWSNPRDAMNTLCKKEQSQL